MSQNNETLSVSMEANSPVEQGVGQVVKSTVISSGLDTESSEIAKGEENDSSDRDTDSGLQVNSHSHSASGGDDSSQPSADESSNGAAQATNVEENDTSKPRALEGENEPVSSSKEPEAHPHLPGMDVDKQGIENNDTACTSGEKAKTNEETGEDSLGPQKDVTLVQSQTEAKGAPTDSSAKQGTLETSSSETTKETSESPAPKISKIEAVSEPENAASKEGAGAAAMATDAASVAAASAVEGAAASPVDSEEKSQLQSVYHIKWIRFKESLYPIVTQNENGPCPLLAIINMLILQGKVKMPTLVEMVTSGQLMEYLADCIFEHAPKNITEDAQLNYEQNMHDAMAVFHKLQTGLDVNVKFNSVSTFEYTPECIVFDLLGIPLYHGWLVDPDSPSEVAAVGNCGYNQLVEKIITQKNSAKEELVTEALIAEDFLNRTASQLTYHGLSELSTTLKDEQMCVFFRNNHFSTLYKRKNELFQLVTDQGFLTESNVVWETLSNVEGDGHFVDADFHTYRKAEASTHPIPQSPVPVGSDAQVDTDYLVALSLQQEAQQQLSVQQPDVAMRMAPAAAGGPGGLHLSDHELAMRLQEEENRVAKQRQQQLANQQHLSQQHQQRMAAEARGSGGDKKKEKSTDCVIL